MAGQNNPQQGFGRRGPGFAAPVEKPQNGRETLRRLLQYFKSERTTVLIMAGVVIVSVIASVLAPSFQSSAIDKVVAGEYGMLPRMLALMLAMHLIHGIASLVQGYISASLSQNVVSRLRKELFDKIVHLPVSYIDSHSHGDLISRMTNDADNISNIISQSLSSLFSGILTLIGTLIMMLRYSIPLGLLSCSTIGLTVLVTSFFSKYMRKFFVKRQTLLGKLNGTVEEMVTNYKTITAYNQQEAVIEQFTGTADQLTHTGIVAEIISNCMGPVMNMLSNVSFVIVSVFGAYFALKGYITVGVISAFIIYSKQFSRPINELAQLYGQIQTAVAGAERVFDILDTDTEHAEGLPLKEVRCRSRARNIPFIKTRTARNQPEFLRSVTMAGATN